MSPRKRTRSSVAQELALDEGVGGSSGSGPAKPAKIPRHGPANNPIVISDDDDDLQEILAQIKAQDDSEALAKSLQKELDHDAGSSSHGAHVEECTDVIMVDSGSEDAEVEEVVKTKAKANSSGKDKGKGKAVARTNGAASSRSPHKQAKETITVKPGEEPPDERVIPFRELFTSSRHCSKCNQELESPRGDVRSIRPFFTSK